MREGPQNREHNYFKERLRKGRKGVLKKGTG